MKQNNQTDIKKSQKNANYKKISLRTNNLSWIEKNVQYQIIVNVLVYSFFIMTAIMCVYIYAYTYINTYTHSI